MFFRFTFQASVATVTCACVLSCVSVQAAGPDAPPGFRVETIAHVRLARELAATADGALIVGTGGSGVFVIRDAEGTPQPPELLVDVGDAPAAGVALGPGALYIGSQFAVWRVPYGQGAQGMQRPVKIESVRPGGSGGHDTTSVAVAAGHLFYSVGASCNACTERDPTRASIFEADLDGRDSHLVAKRIRNAIALAVQPGTDAVWAGVAGQDELEHGHPYEIFDPFTAHAGTPDYGWPICYENRRPVHAGDDCSQVAVSRVVFPAYDTPIGAVFYPLHESGRYAFPPEYAGGAFVAMHGSWHLPPVPPRVAFVPFRDGEPDRAVDWNDPTVQWREFLSGFQGGFGWRIGRPTGVAVGSQGSLFVADDKAGVVYRIRPSR
jgi:glucose/arabinose dehydrogenase